jgi:PKD repeat protein
VTITAGESVVFTGTGSDADGDLPLSYLWQFGAGSGVAAQSVEDPGAVRFDVPGVYTVTFTVTDARGLPDPTPASVVVTVQSAGPAPNTAPNGVIDTPAGAVTITAGESVVFTGTGSDADGDLPLSYLWQFGAGSGVAAQSVEDPGAVRFDVPGVYTVTFTVTDARGLADPTPASVVVTVQSAGTTGALFSEDFEGSLECEGTRWNCYRGAPSTINPDSTAVVGGLFAGQSLRADAGAMWENAHAYARLASQQETLYFRTHLYLNSEALANGSSSGLLFLGNTDLSSLAATVYLRKNGAGERYLELAIPEGSPRATYPVDLQSEYELELYLDDLANQWEWRMNGATVASGAADPGTGVHTFLLSSGYRSSGGSVDVYFDNVEVD